MGVGGDGVAKPEVMKGLPKMVEREGGRSDKERKVCVIKKVIN